MTYEFRQGVPVPSGLAAETAAQELERIRQKMGLTPKSVVDASRPKNAPLHKCFEWDDGKAAEMYREGQARTIIRAVIVVEEERSTPVYYHIQEPEQPPRYEHIQVLKTRPDLYSDAMHRMKAELAAAARSVRELEQHAPKAKAKAVKRLADTVEKAQQIAANI